MKFRGAGQGAKVLVAELDRRADSRSASSLPIPELALVDVGERFGRSEPDPEIQDLLRRSHGTNVGTALPRGRVQLRPRRRRRSHLARARGAHRLARRVHDEPGPHARTTRTCSIWQRRPWLIDHGAALYAHHDWARSTTRARVTSFPLIRSHVLLAAAAISPPPTRSARRALTPDVIDDVVDAVPDDLLLDNAGGPPEFASAADARERYARYLTRRLAPPRAFAAEAIAAQEQVRRRAAAAPRRPADERRARVDYDFAVLRVVPRVHLGAFVNVGVVVHARTAEFLALRAVTDERVLAAHVPGVDAELLARYLRSCERDLRRRRSRRADGARAAIGALSLAHRAALGRVAELARARGGLRRSAARARRAVRGVRRPWSVLAGDGDGC